MGRILQNQTNVNAPDSDYPYGRIRNNPGNQTGTPVNEAVYGDVHQFLARMADKGEIALNDLPDNDYTGFQYFEALEAIIGKKIEKDQLSFAISGGGATITTGLKGKRRVPFKFLVTGWEIVGDSSGSAVCDVWRTDWANIPADNGDSIMGSEEPELSASIKGQNLALTIPVLLQEGDYLYFNLDSNTNQTEITITLIGLRVSDPL